MKIIDIKLEKIKPFAKNNKIHSTKQVEMIANSIKEFGFKNPIILDKNNEIIAWHGRLLAAQQLGMETVPCIMADDLTPKQVKAYRLLDNRISDFAQYDLNNIAEELKEVGDTQLWLETLDGIFDGIITKDTFTDDFTLPEWEKWFIETMTFTLHKTQKESVMAAIDLANSMGEYSGENKNTNGNALERICTLFIEANA